MDMELLSLQYLLFIFLLSLFLYIYFNTSQLKPTNNNKGFKSYPLVGCLPEFLRHRYRFLDWTTEVLSECPNNTAVFLRPGKFHGIMTANPANVEYTLKTNFENYPKGDKFLIILQDFLGQGIFNSDGELWKVQRKTASYEFSTKSLRNFVMDNVRAELSTRLVPILKRASRTQAVMDLQDVLERFAFDNICKVAFNFDPGCLSGDATAGAGFMRAFEDATTHSSDNIIKTRMETRTEEKDEDLLSRFIRNGENSPGFLRDIIVSFILAGRDTTSSALSWFFWLLSHNPEVEQKILNELEMIRTRYGKKVGDTYGFDELRDMHYLQAAISESLRLYPPVPVDTKDCLKDDILPDDTFIGKGWFITYNAYAMGRMESIWGTNCHEYLPERWLENGIYRPENSFRFPVFHAGPRICLGKDMAYIQMKSIAASVLETFQIEVQNKDKCIEHLLSLTLRIKGGLHVKLKERSVEVMN
ncbi:p450 domain-containing protein [Cephalotus follicularis]|uniref:p450 domain-containing protein n=1 Tax=Cephalotus follicularis TaxID=3775 RepID=A0A1Q3D2C6_CEPFO|nr:p450 domain-containing protein [Cephalotus follicularis]